MSYIVRFTLIAGLVFAVAGSAGAQKRGIPKRKSKNDTLRIVVIGSSTAAGSGAYPRENSWVHKYREYLNAFQGPVRVTNLAHGMFTSYHLQPDWFASPPRWPMPDSARNISKALSLKPHAIVMNLPSNDVALDIPLVELMENFERIVHLCDSAHVPLWITTSQPRNLSTRHQQGLHLLYDWIKARFGENAIDFWDGLATPEGGIMPLLDSGDGTHLNNAGHALLLERILMKDIPATVRSTSAAARGVPAPTVFSVFVLPNPFTESTVITANLARGANTVITISDLLGGNKRTVQNGYLERGRHSIPAGMEGAPPGVYFYQIRSGKESRFGKLIKLPD